MTSVQIAHNWCAIVIRHRFQYTLEAIVVYCIHHHDVSTEEVNAVALLSIPVASSSSRHAIRPISDIGDVGNVRDS